MTADIDIDLEILGFIDSSITVNIIRRGVIAEKKELELPKKLKNVIQCKNPRCITSIEEEVDHIFLLGGDKKYRCAYCEQEFHPGPSR